MTRASSALVVVAAVLASAPAHAEPVALVLTGEPALQEPVAAQVKAWLGEHGFTVAAPLSKDTQDTLANCFVMEDLGCARGVFEHQSALASLVFAHVDLQPTTKTRGVVITGYWMVRDHEAVAEKRECKPCTDAALHDTVVATMDSLQHAAGLVKTQAAPPQVTTVERPSRVLPIALVCAGIATLGAGGVALYYGHKSGPDEVYIYPHATRDGEVLAGAGGVIAFAGVLWLLHTGGSSTATASIGPGGTLVGWAGRF